MGLVSSATPVPGGSPASIDVSGFTLAVGNRLVAVAAHRSGVTSTSLSPGTWTVDVQNNDYGGDSSHRRGVEIQSIVIDAQLQSDIATAGDSITFSTDPVTTSWVALLIEVDEGDGYTAAETASDDNGDSGVSGSVDTGTTASVDAGDWLVVTAVSSRGGTSLTAGTYDDTEISYNEASGSPNSVCGAMYAEYLSGQSSGTAGDTITLGTDREASAAIVVYRAAGSVTGVGAAALGGVGDAAATVGRFAGDVDADLGGDGAAAGVVGLSAGSASAALGPAASGSGVAGDVSSGGSAALGGTAAAAGVAGDVSSGPAADLGGTGGAAATVGLSATGASADLGGAGSAAGVAGVVSAGGSADLGGAGAAEGTAAATAAAAADLGGAGSAAGVAGVVSAGGSADLGGAGAAEGTAVGGEGGVGDAALGGAGSAAGVVGVAASTVSAPLEVDGDASGVVGLAAAAAAAELGPAASGSGVAGDVSSGASAVLGGTATGSGVAGDVATSAAADLGGAGAAEGTVGVAGSASAVLGGTATGSGDGATPVTGTGAAALGGVASASGRVAAGDPVVAIYDAADGPIGSSSVTGWNAYAGSSGAAPTLTLNGGAPALVAAATPAGTPAVQFAASDEGLLSGDIADRQQPWTAAFVARVTTDGFCFGFRASNVDYIRRQASLNRWLVSSGFPDGFNQVVPDSAPDDWHVWVIVADGTSSVVSIDGSETAVELQNPVTHLTFGSFRPSGQSSPMHWADLEVAEFRVLAGAEDASARAALVAELTAKHLTAPTPETPTVEGNSAGWDALVSILESSRAEAWQSARDEALEPLACPNDGQPLRRAADGGLFCEFDGWRPDGGSAYRAGRAGGAPGEAGDRDWGGLASIQADIASSSRIAGRRVGEVSCPLCGEPLVDGQDGERRCLYDGWPDADV